jgi:LysM repeat protein
MLKKAALIPIFLLCSAFGFAQGVVSDYIEKYTQKAQELMLNNKVPASLILAVAIHESAAGTSKIAKHLNNHFGFKGPNSNTEIQSAYRDFTDVDSSYNYFISFLKSRKKINQLFDKLDQYDFRSWAKGLQKGGYAHSRIWAVQVIGIINKYKLYELDNRPDDYIEPEAVPTITKKTAARSKRYTVKNGDNLSIIAERQGTTVKALKQKNGLKKDALKIGQKLKL